MKRKRTSVAGIEIFICECDAVRCEGLTFKLVPTSELMGRALCSEHVSQRVVCRALRDWLVILEET